MLLSRKFVKALNANHCRYLGDRNGDITALLRDALSQVESVQEKGKETWSLSSNSRKRSKKSVRDIQYFVPPKSDIFSQFTDITNKSVIEKLNGLFDRILPIQEKAVPLALLKRSLLVQSETGSGKTLVYAIPIVNDLLNGMFSKNNRCLIIAPSKELCIQIFSVLLSILPKSHLSEVLLLVGDKNGQKQKTLNRMLCNNGSIIIATPGPLNLKLKQGVIRLLDMGTVVIDEYDRLFQDDFESQVGHIFSKIAAQYRSAKLPPQVILVSATLSPQMRDYVAQEIPGIEEVFSNEISPSSLTHEWIIAPLHRRTETLLHLLEQHKLESGDTRRSILFVQRKEIGEGVYDVLRDEGYYVAFINGDMSQTKRDTISKEFKDGSYDILIATDLIARGIDFPECEVVIQIQPGPDADMYLHRAGRAARAGRPGSSYVIACEADLKDKEALRAVKDRLTGVRVTEATSFLPEKESGASSILENSLHYVSERDELSFSVDITMTEPLIFYEKMIADLDLKPVNAARVPKKMIFGLWFASPVEAWSASAVIKQYFKINSLPAPDMGVYRHALRQQSVVDWDEYFRTVRLEAREETKLRYKNWVKSEMGKKRIRKGRYKFKPTFTG